MQNTCTPSPLEEEKRLIKSLFNSQILQLLSIQSPCAQCFKRSIFKVSKFGVKKNLLIKKLPALEDGSFRDYSNLF